MNVIKMEDSFVGIEIQGVRYDGANVFYGSRCVYRDSGVTSIRLRKKGRRRARGKETG